MDNNGFDFSSNEFGPSAPQQNSNFNVPPYGAQQQRQGTYYTPPQGTNYYNNYNGPSPLQQSNMYCTSGTKLSLLVCTILGALSGSMLVFGLALVGYMLCDAQLRYHDVTRNNTIKSLHIASWVLFGLHLVGYIALFVIYAGLFSELLSSL